MSSNRQTIHAYIGLGSNLDNPQQHVERALLELARIPRTRLEAASSLYRSEPMGPQDQPPYINAVALLETELDAHELLDQLQSIEQAHGRVRGAQRWGPRTLDLDLLLYGAAVIHSERLEVPHPGMADRGFVLYPLHEISPALVLPDGRALSQCLAACTDEGLQRLGG